MASPPNAGHCMIRPTPAEPCPFQATAGPVALKVVNVTGSVTFVTASYEGGPVTVTPQVITFNIVPGNHLLTVTYLLTDPKGRGALHEVCPGDTFLGDVFAGNETVGYRICA